MEGKYGSQTAIRLREKLTGEDKTEEMKEDYDRLYNNHYNACYNECAKRTLRKITQIKKRKSFLNMYKNLKQKTQICIFFGKLLLQKILFLNKCLKYV